jgi:hypothetical protein
MVGATAKYTQYLASRCERFIALSVTRWPDATNTEVIDSIVPVAEGLAAVLQPSHSSFEKVVVSHRVVGTHRPLPLGRSA